MMVDRDDQLLDGIAAGDVSSMQAMVIRKLPRLLALATRMLGDPTEAEDVAQETFLRIWKHAGHWQRENAKFDTWIHRVALNLCYDRLNKRKAHATVEQAECPDEKSYEIAALPQGLTGSDVERALQAIAPRQREAIILVYYQDMSNRDAADAMDITVDALESLLSRGRRALETILGEPS